MGINVLEWKNVLNAVAMKCQLELRWMTEDGRLLLEDDRSVEQAQLLSKWTGLIRQASSASASFIFDAQQRNNWMVEPIPMHDRKTYFIAGPWESNPLDTDRERFDEIRQFVKLLSTFYASQTETVSVQKERMIHLTIGFINDSLRAMGPDGKRMLTHRILFLHAFLVQMNWKDETVFSALIALFFKHLPDEFMRVYLPADVHGIVESYQYWFTWIRQKSQMRDAVQWHSINGTNERMFQNEGQLLAITQYWFDLSPDQRSRMTRSEWQSLMHNWFGELSDWQDKLVQFAYSWKLSQFVVDEMRHTEEEQTEDQQLMNTRARIQHQDLVSFIRSLTILSRREKEVLALIIRGKSNKDISKDLFISEHTVKHHVTNILNKLGVTDRFHAFVWLYQNSGL
jgi:DNA-binding CsgD family transcriptional regulator